MDESHQTLLDIVERHAGDHGNERAITFLEKGELEAGHLSWEQLVESSQKAAVDISLRVGEGDRVLILMATGLTFPVAFLGCLYAGAIPVPTSLPSSVSEMRRTHQIITDCEPSLILCEDESFCEKLNVKTPTHRLSLSGYSSLPKTGISPEDICLLQYTSGSTRVPQGVKITHRNLLWNLQMNRDAFATGQGSVFVNWCPLFHDLGLITMMLHSLYVGGHLVLMSPASFLRKPVRWMKAVSKYRGTMIIAPNFGYEMLLNHLPDELNDLDLTSLKIASNAAEPIRASTLCEFGKRLSSAGLRPEAVTCSYGLAEATVYASSSAVEAPPTILRADRWALDAGSFQIADETSQNIFEIAGVGNSVFPGKIRIVDPETRHGQPENEIGEIWIRGPHLSNGYWGKSEVAIFIATIEGENDRWLRTGDLGFIRGGELFVCGRLKESINIRGRTLYPQDMEAVISGKQFPEVRKRGVVVFGLEDDNSDDFVVLVEVGSAFENFFQTIAERIRSNIAEEFHLEIYEILFVSRGTVSRTTSGKLERNACRKRYLAGTIEFHFRSSLSKVPEFSNDLDANDSTNTICGIIASELGVRQVDPTKSLFQYGIDSIKFATIVAHIESKLDRSIPYQRWVMNPTINKLSELLEIEADEKFIEHSKPESNQKTGLLSRLRRKFIEIGPTFRGRPLVSHTAGTTIQRSLFRWRFIQRCLFGELPRQLRALLHDAGASPEETEERILQNLVANTWTIWRASIFEDKRNFESGVEVIGGKHLESDRPIILACSHSGGLRTVVTAFLKERGRPFTVIGNLREKGLVESGLEDLASEVAQMEMLPGLAIRSAQVIAASARLRSSDGVAVIFADASLGRKGITTPFHSISRTVRPGLAQLALNCEARVVPVTVQFSGTIDRSTGLSIEFHPPLANPNWELPESDRINQMLSVYGEHLQKTAVESYGSLEGFLIENLYSQLKNRDQQNQEREG